VPLAHNVDHLDGILYAQHMRLGVQPIPVEGYQETATKPEPLMVLSMCGRMVLSGSQLDPVKHCRDRHRMPLGLGYLTGLPSPGSSDSIAT
jgi:hypothetical protein